MRQKALALVIPLILLAQSPALAKMHDIESPPGLKSLIKFVIWGAILYWVYRKYLTEPAMAMTAGTRVATGAGSAAAFLAFATVAASLLVGIYVEAFLKLALGVPLDKPLGLWTQIVCLCVVNLVVLAVMWMWAARRLFNRPVGFSQSLRLTWIPAILPAAYMVVARVLLR